jgi:hypothetical protein
VVFIVVGILLGLANTVVFCPHVDAVFCPQVDADCMLDFVLLVFN